MLINPAFPATIRGHSNIVSHPSACGQERVGPFVADYST